MFGPTLFEIPVYRVSPQHWALERGRAWARQLASMRRYADSDRAPIAQSLVESWQRSFEQRFGPWDYREVIGWIRLVAHFNDIIAHAWRIRAKRVAHDVRKNFSYWSDLFRVSLLRPRSAHDVYSELVAELQHQRKRAPFKGRYIDLTAFNLVGPLIDWPTAVANARTKRAV